MSAEIMEIEGVVKGAYDAATDEMVGRLATTAADTIDMLDQINRAGLAKAIPVLAQMVNDGDLQRVVHLARVLGSAEDALTDGMIGRLSEAAGDGLALLDQINRSGIDKALPTIARMVTDGDLERLAQLARVYGSAQDVLTDEMVGRLAETVGEGMSLLDRLNRGGAVRLVEMLEHLDSTGTLERIASGLPALVDRLDAMAGMFKCFEEAAAATAQEPPSGGVTGAWQLMTDARNQQTLKFMMEVGQRMQTSCLKR